jgi:putative ABC transport system permease protein
MQAAALRTNLLGRFVDQYIVFPPVFRLSGSINLDVLTTELERYPGVRVTASNLYPWQPTGGAQARLRRDAGESDGVPADNLAVAHDFFGVMDIRVVAGRVFSRDRADDRFPSRGAASPTVPVSAVLDSVAARQLGWSNPAEAIGQVIYGAGPPAQIIGVVENTPLSYRSRGSGATVYFLAPQFAFTTYVRVDGSRIEESLAHVNRVVRALAPDRTTPHMFLDEAFEEAYRPWTVMGRISTGVALFASTIAAVGLFGMASFMTRRRTREIGVRKSQGASTISILRLLWWDFSKPVLLAYSFVVPIGYIATRSYLDLFVTRMDLTPLPFIYALLLSLGVAWVAVGSHVILAARVNPAVALRHE